MTDLERRPGESGYDYHRRLVYGKLSDGTLADTDYSELSPFVYGKEYSSDVARRMMYGSKRTLEILDAEREASILEVSTDDMIRELDEKKRELQKEKQRFFDQRREYNKLVNRDGRAEHLEERLANAAMCVGDTVGRLYTTGTSEVTDSDTEAVLVLCDWHYGLQTANMWNEYNSSICKERVAQVIQKAEKRLQLHHCSKLHVVVLGDLIHGAIHTSARVASDELVCDQLMEVSEILAQSIHELSRYVNETVVYVTYGNHARTVQNKNDSIHRDNMERLVSWWLRERLKDCDNISIEPDSEDEFIFLDVCYHGICASHGDLDGLKSSTRVLPMLFQKKYGVDIDMVLLADKHHRESFEELGVSAMICDALCGTDDYANGKRLYSTPGQLMVVLTKGSNDVAEYHLRCD